MAGLVPAIHVLQNCCMAGGGVDILTNRRNGILYVGVTGDLIGRVYERQSGVVDALTRDATT
jgi:putative endonuclease